MVLIAFWSDEPRWSGIVFISGYTNYFRTGIAKSNTSQGSVSALNRGSVLVLQRIKGIFNSWLSFYDGCSNRSDN